jgi:hypothetical protein
MLYSTTGASSIADAEKQLFADFRFRKTPKGNFVRPGLLGRWLKGTKPNDNTLSIMNRRVPGSRDLYEHPLWKILACESAPSVAVLYPLIPAVGSEIFHPAIRGPTQRPALVAMNAALFHRLQSIPSLDALAALLFCVKRSEQDKDFELAIHALQSFYRLALWLGAFRPLADVIPPLVALVCSCFPLSRWTHLRWLAADGIEMHVSEVLFCLTSECISKESLHKGEDLCWTERMNLLFEFVDPAERDLPSQATRLCLLLDPKYLDDKVQALFGNRTASWLAIEEINAPCHWVSTSRFRRKNTIHITEGILAGSSHEVLC